jgi:hypothetical protein
VARRERDVLERAVHAVAEQAANTNKVVDEAMDAGLASDHPVNISPKQARLELLRVKADLERELSKLVLNCTACGMEVHSVSGVNMADPGHWRGPPVSCAARRSRHLSHHMEPSRRIRSTSHLLFEAGNGTSWS